MFRYLLALLPILLLQAQAPLRPLLVISIDGLDNRYLRDADQMGLKIPNLRKLMAVSEMAQQGVLGVFGTVTWPSHTSMITGVRPSEHGILNNKRPSGEGGDYYWTVKLLKSKTLWHRVKEAGGTTAAITWPVTGEAAIDFNLPEYFKRRNGGAMDLETVSAKGTPGLADKIRGEYPSFGTEWMDDRQRTLATMYIVKNLKPALTLLHFVDLDSEQHERGPFTPEARAMLEYTDELIGRIVAVAPANSTIAVVSDHGFERSDKVLNPYVLVSQAGLKSDVTVASGIVIAKSAEVAAFLADKPGIGRKVPLDELTRFAPELAQGAVAAFEPAEHVLFGRGLDVVWAEQKSRGEHGLWPGRPDYRSVFLVSGPSIKPNKLGEISMVDINARFEKLLGLAK